jgi:galactoside O-acetyltransferase
MGFKHIGQNVKISDCARFYNIGEISIGDNSRIDDFCILSGKEIKIGRYVHIACYAQIVGQGVVIMEDYSAISAKGCIFSSTDSYSGEYMTNPCVPEEVRNTTHGMVYIGRHVVIGAGSVVLPNVSLGHGCAVGALSLVNQTWGDNNIIAGIPAKYKGTRNKNIYELEKRVQ